MGGEKFSFLICHALTLLTYPSLAEMLIMTPDTVPWPSVTSFLCSSLAQPAWSPSVALLN